MRLPQLEYEIRNDGLSEIATSTGGGVAMTIWAQKTVPEISQARYQKAIWLCRWVVFDD